MFLLLFLFGLAAACWYSVFSTRGFGGIPSGRFALFKGSKEQREAEAAYRWAFMLVIAVVFSVFFLAALVAFVAGMFR